jgi:hypothetical protein
MYFKYIWALGTGFIVSEHWRVIPVYLTNIAYFQGVYNDDLIHVYIVIEYHELICHLSPHRYCFLFVWREYLSSKCLLTSLHAVISALEL